MPAQNSPELPKIYDPIPVEKKAWERWEATDIFSPRPGGKGTKAFSIVIPPPNVTGFLHMGHALNNTLQDILVRYHRMLGESVLWVFGMDHAGIATQNVVERQLKSEGKTRHELGREAFIQRVWKWKEESGGAIRHQLKKLGCSLDYHHERFTMDEGLSRAVREVFVTLFQQGKIYRAQRLINWCPRCQTALSDLEVEYQETHGHLWHIRYPLEADPQDFVVVATTRPETLLGDTAVAVHPDDERYKKMIGKRLELPLTGRLIPLLADAMVDPGFGSGAVKVTPAHDFNDFEVGNRHGLERINVLTEDGRMNENAGVYRDQDRFECRRNVVKALEEQELLDKVEDYKTSVGHCYRCKTVVEPFLSMQWFVKTDGLAKSALEAVKSGKTRIVPEQWQNTYFAWMENIRDWCISRQIWWGHRIPAWYCGRCAESAHPSDGVIVSLSDLTVCPHCGHNDLKQETDVLDTWFSSALWPFSTLGWPEATERLKTFYPTSVLVTGFDIIFFWVARMMMMGLHFTDQVPFRDVYIHALVRDAEGQKMSKSKGNVIDPLQVMEKHGTDAFRFTLAALAAQGRDIKLSEERVLGYRNFCNKIWNAARFILSTAHPLADPKMLSGDVALSEINPHHEINQWILTKLSECITEVRRSLDECRFNDAAMGVYHFLWGTYCDWYLELVKDPLKTAGHSHQREFATVAVRVLDEMLRLLHPFMPFLTEEIWQSLTPRGDKVLAASAFPQALPKEVLAKYEASFRKTEALTAVIDKLRQIRMETGVPLSEILPRASVYSADSEIQSSIQSIAHAALHLAKVGHLQINDEALKKDKGIARGVTRYGDIVVLVDLKGAVDLEKERKRQEKELAHLAKGLEGTRKLLASADFQAKAPDELVAEKKAAEAAYVVKMAEIEAALKLL